MIRVSAHIRPGESRLHITGHDTDGNTCAAVTALFGAVVLYLADLAAERPDEITCEVIDDVHSQPARS
jgi:hypothetical protein